MGSAFPTRGTGETFRMQGSAHLRTGSGGHCWRLVTHLHLTNLSGLGWIMVSPPLQHQDSAHHCTQFLCGCLGHRVVSQVTEVCILPTELPPELQLLLVGRGEARLFLACTSDRRWYWRVQNSTLTQTKMNPVRYGKPPSQPRLPGHQPSEELSH